MNAIQLKDLTISLGGREVLAGVSLKIESGEFIGVVGPNGAGKTTLMRAILGLLPITSGELRVFGKSPARGNPAIGYMPQVRSTGQRLRLTGREFVAAVVNGYRLGLPLLGKKARAEVERALNLVGASGLARQPLTEMSRGERQRLLLAQALVGKPKLLMLDEPLASLDPRYQSEVVELSKALQQELGITVLFTAHDLNPLLGTIDRVLYLGRGQAALGTVDEVITVPVLSRLYGAEIDVVHAKGRIFVMADGHHVEPGFHSHNPGITHAHPPLQLPHDDA